MNSNDNDQSHHPHSILADTLPPGAVSPAALETMLDAAILENQDVPAFVATHLDDLARLQLSDPDRISRLFSRIRKHLSTAQANRLLDTVDEHAQKLRRRICGEAMDRVIDSLADLPEAGALRVPPAYRIDAVEGVVRLGRKPIQVAPSPLLITGRSRDIQSQMEWTRLTWLRDGQWVSHTVPRAQIADHHQLLQLSALGAPVTSINAAELVRYLAEFEAMNLDLLKPTRVSVSMGWQEGGFLWGRQWLGDPAQTVELSGSVDDGKLVDGFVQRGALDGWLGAVAAVANHPAAMLAVYAALSAPLLPILDADNFVVDWSNPTSTGKTTVLRLAASCWGRPDERALLQSWNNTRVFVERMAELSCDLPLILDDTKKANPDQLARTVYEFSGGHGRGRGARSGVQRTATWRGVLLSTGENPIASYTRGDGGAHARVLSVWAPPLGEPGEASRQQVNQLREELLAHYGHAGPRWVTYLHEHRQDWSDLRLQYQQLKRELARRDITSPVVDRLSSYLAVIWLTGRLATSVLQLPGDPDAVIDRIMALVMPTAEEADRARAALAYVVSWAIANRTHFHEDYSQSGVQFRGDSCLGKPR